MDKLIKVTLYFKRPDGSKYMRTAEDADAAKWNEMNTSVATIAQIHGCNPDWQKVNWETAEVARPTAEQPTIEEMSGSVDYGGKVDCIDL